MIIIFHDSHEQEHFLNKTGLPVELLEELGIIIIDSEMYDIVMWLRNNRIVPMEELIASTPKDKILLLLKRDKEMLKKLIDCWRI